MSVWKTLVMQVRANRNTSRNIGETRWNRVRRWFWFCVFLCKAVWIAVSQLGREHLGSEVIVNGKRGTIANWSNSSLPSVVIEGEYHKVVPREQIRNVLSVSEFRHRFRTAFSWYCHSWMMIDIHKRLYSEAYKSGDLNL